MKYFRLIRYFLYWILTVAGVMLILPLLFRMQGVRTQSPLAVLSDDWTVERNESSRTGVRISGIVDAPLMKGEAIVLLHELPEEEVPHAGIEMTLKNASARIFLDDELLASYGEGAVAKRRPEETFVFPLPDNYAGRTLQIAITADSDRAFSSLQPVTVGRRSDLFRRWSHDRIYAVLYGAYFFLQGVILCVLTLLILTHIRQNVRIIFAALLSLGAGAYTLGTSGMLRYFYRNPSLGATLTTTGAVLVPLAVLGIGLDFLIRWKRGEASFSYRVSQKPSLSDIPLLAGCGAVVLGGLLQLIFRQPMTGGLTVFMLGLFVFQGCLLESFYFFAEQYLGETRRHLQLSGIAYTDALTGQSNRAHCEQFMRDLDAGKDSYFIINYDVNGLKKINDTQGHAEGDRFLKGFAQILAAYFKSADLIGRMGGDEFVVIYKNIDPDTGTDRADGLPVLLYKLNRTKSIFKYEASYGCAHSGEVKSRKSSDVYRLADERMYEMKRIVHLRNGGNGRD